MKHRDEAVAILDDELRSISIDLDGSALESCVHYWDLLEGASRKINLVSRGDLVGGLIRHVGDSLAALRFGIGGEPSTLLDIGSGGGLPGIPLAIAAPGVSVTLLEPRERRADWLVRTVHDLSLSERVTVRVSRIEDLPGDFTTRFDFMTARALAPPDKVIPPLLAAMGHSSRLLIWHSDQQLDKIGERVKAQSGARTFELKKTLSHHFNSINFSSSISVINEVH